jgi:hypothetical protein
LRVGSHVGAKQLKGPNRDVAILTAMKLGLVAPPATSEVNLNIFYKAVYIVVLQLKEGHKAEGRAEILCARNVTEFLAFV